MEKSYASDSSYYDMQRVFLRGLTVRDIAEPLLSFDAWTQAGIVRALLEVQGQRVVGIREDGRICGYILTEELGDGSCGDFMRPFDEDLVLSDHTPLVDLVPALVDSPHAFVRVLGDVGGIVTREDLQDPPVRMWLFGIVTIIEMYYLRMIEQHLGDGEWRKYLSPGRIAKAEARLEERQRRNQNPSLLDCLQFGDKAQIVSRDEALRNQAGFQSRKRADRATKMLEGLRNNLAHTQDIVSWDWETIVVLAENIDQLLKWDQSLREA
jgi:hypothetical protein